MRKPRSNGPLSALTPAQRARVDALLFTENRTYPAVVEMLRRDFGVAVSKTSVGGYYKKRTREDLAATGAAGSEMSTVRAAGVEVNLVRKGADEIVLTIRAVPVQPDRKRRA